MHRLHRELQQDRAQENRMFGVWVWGVYGMCENLHRDETLSGLYELFGAVFPRVHQGEFSGVVRQNDPQTTTCRTSV